MTCGKLFGMSPPMRLRATTNEAAVLLGGALPRPDGHRDVAADARRREVVSGAAVTTYGSEWGRRRMEMGLSSDAAAASVK